MGGVVNNPDRKFCRQSIRYIYIYIYEKLEESQNSWWKYNLLYLSRKIYKKTTMRNKYSLTILCEHLPINFFRTHFNSLKAQINELFQMNFNSLKAWINELIQMHFYRIQSIKSLSCQVIYSHKWQSPFNAYIFMVVCQSCSTSYVALVTYVKAYEVGFE